MNMSVLKRLAAMMIACYFAMAVPVEAATLNIKGNVDVQGDGSTASPGNLSVNGKLSVKGDQSVDGGLSVDDDLDVYGGFQVPRFYKRYSQELVDTKNTVPLTMGAWDVCFLSNILIAGQDDDALDSAQCRINTSLGLQTGRPTWTLTISAGSTKIDKLQCSAICFSFGTNCTAGSSC
jgi:hypothetical protein